jgi:1-acyl-sn-glycerol-3-phosphate acyltransferase
LRKAIDSGAGVLITPNHSFHYDSYVLGHAAQRVGRPFHFLTAWQVFAMSTPFQRWVMQRHGCFSIDRESADVGAFKKSVEILRSHPCPLAIFPEGDIYHTNDRVMPFREGAAAIALSAAKRADRPIVAIPAAIKCHYVDDPMPGLLELMDRLELAVHWRPRPDLPLTERIYRFATGMLALKELEYLGQPQSGTVPQRTRSLANRILEEKEQRFAIQRQTDSIPDRVKELRRHFIQQLERPDLDVEMHAQLKRDMEDLFLVIQLYSYPGDYVAENPSIDRIAETLDKFEEDVLRVTYPKPRGTRHATVTFGEPIPVPSERGARDAVAVLTNQLEQGVQSLLNSKEHHAGT